MINFVPPFRSRAIHLNFFTLASYTAGGLILLFIIAPLLHLFLASTGSQLFETLNDSEVTTSIGLTLGISFATTLFFAIPAIPFSYILARKQFMFKKVLQSLIDIPIIIPHSAVGIAILGVIANDWFRDTIGFNPIGHPVGIGIAMAYVSLPFLINSATDGFASVPVRLEKAAYSLGASEMRTFFTISLALSWRNILSGLVMMFARGMSEFGAVIIIAYHPMTMPTLIYERFGMFGLDYVRPAAVLFILISLFVFIVLRWLSIKNDK